MKLADDDGKPDGDIAELSTKAKFYRFVNDFKPRKISYTEETVGGESFIILSLQDAYEYMSKMTYVDNWESEMHEEFGFYSIDKWAATLMDAGFVIVEGSRTFHNPYIIENRYKGKVLLLAKYGDELLPIPYPPTNMILVGEKPVVV